MTADWRLPQFLSPLPLPWLDGHFLAIWASPQQSKHSLLTLIYSNLISHYVVDQRSTAWSTANIRSSFDTLGFLNRGFISVIIVSLVNPVSNDLRNSLWTKSWSYFVSAAGDFDKTINFFSSFLWALGYWWKVLAQICCISFYERRLNAFHWSWKG